MVTSNRKRTQNVGDLAWHRSATLLGLALFVGFSLSGGQTMQPTRLGSGDNQASYYLTLFALMDTTAIKLPTDGARLEVLLDSAVALSAQDHEPTNVSEKGWFQVVEPTSDGTQETSGVASTAWSGPKTSDTRNAGIGGFVIRRDETGHFSLGIVTDSKSVIYCPRRIAAIPAGLLDIMTDRSTGTAELGKLTPELLRSHGWPFRSSTDVTVFEDPDGYLSMKGRVEFMLVPAEGGVGTPRLLITHRLVLHCGVTPNFGEGTKVVLKNLATPVELLGPDGNDISAASGTYIRSTQGWRPVK